MKRITFDKIVTFVGFGLGVFLLIDAKVTFGGAIFMFLFVILGIRHIRRTPLDATI